MTNILISKANQTLEVDWDAMPDNAKAFIIEYGLKQKLNDATSSIKKDEENAAALALAASENVLEALMKGNITVRSGKSSMTLEERCLQKAIRTVFKKFVGENLKQLEDDSNEALLEKLTKKLGKDEATILAACEKHAAVLVKIEQDKAALPAIEF